MNAASGRGKPAEPNVAAADANCDNCGNTMGMYARQVEEQSSELHELKRDELELMGLTVLCFGLALAAHGRPALALPLLAAGLGGAALAVRAFWRRWDLVDRLLLEREAYEIAEVRARAEHMALLDNRQSLACSIRWRLEHASAFAEPDGRLLRVVPDLRALADELVDETLELDPLRAVECERLLTDGITSPLVDPTASIDELYAWICRIRAGLKPRAVASNY